MDKVYVCKVKRPEDRDLILKILESFDVFPKTKPISIPTLFTFSTENQYLLDVVRGDHSVEYVKLSSTVSPTATEITEKPDHTLNHRVFYDRSYNWGLDRIDSISSRLSRSYDATRTGNNVNIYVVDSGIMMSHWEFNGRALPLYDAWRPRPTYPEWKWWIPTEPAPISPAPDISYYGWPSNLGTKINNVDVPDDHGTHIAAIAAGRGCGVASGASIWSVRIFDHQQIANMDQVLDGIDAIILKHRELNPSLDTYQHDPSNDQRKIINPGVVNLSFTGPRDNVWDTILESLINVGLVVVTSAGNFGTSAYLYSPAGNGCSRHPVTKVTEINSLVKPICVAATDLPTMFGDYFEKLASWSNLDDVVDICAPGVDVHSASFRIDTESIPPLSIWDDTKIYRSRTGTSQSAPFVTGIAALILEDGVSFVGNDIPLINSSVKDQIVSKSQKNIISPETLNFVFEGHNRQTPNVFAHIWYVQTNIEWDGDQIWEYTFDEESIVTLEFSATSLDCYGLRQTVWYSLPNVITQHGSSIPYNITVQKNLFNRFTNEYKNTVKITLFLPSIQDQLDFVIPLTATDGRKTIVNNITLHVQPVWKDLVWEYPDEGPLYLTNSSRDRIRSADPENSATVTQFIDVQFRVNDPNGFNVTYEVSPSLTSLPPGLSFTQTNNIAQISGNIGIIPKNQKIYEFLIKAKNERNITTERSFYFEVQPFNLLHRYSDDWLEYLEESRGFEFQKTKKVYFLAEAEQGNQIQMQLESRNPDNDILTYEITKLYTTSLDDGTTSYIPGGSEWDEPMVPTPYYDPECDTTDPNNICPDKFTRNSAYRLTRTGLVVPLPVYDGILPNGLRLTSDGLIGGSIDINAAPGLYYFGVQIRDVEYGITDFNHDNTLTKYFRIQVTAVSSNPTFQSNDLITWNTNKGIVGEGYELYPSHFQISASSISNSQIEYLLLSTSKLPDPLVLNPFSGAVTGILPMVSEVTDFTFTARARIKATGASIFSDREFTIRVHPRFEDKKILSVVAPVTGDIRQQILKKIWFEKYVTVAELFGPESWDYLDNPDFDYDDSVLNDTEYFSWPCGSLGIVRYPSVYIVGGLKFNTPDEISAKLQPYHQPTYFIIDKLNFSPAYDPSGNIIYEMVYFTLSDPKEMINDSGVKIRPGGFSSSAHNEERLIYPHNTESARRSMDFHNKDGLLAFYPTSIRNMRLDFITTSNRLESGSGIGLANTNEHAPLWLLGKNRQTIPQSDFQLTMPICYVKPGLGKSVVSHLRQNGFEKDFSGKRISVKSYLISGLGYGMDTPDTVIGHKVHVL